MKADELNLPSGQQKAEEEFEIDEMAYITAKIK